MAREGMMGFAWKAWVIVERVSAFVPGGFLTVFLLQQSPAVGSALVLLADLRGSFKEGGCVAEIWAVLYL
jgi:hypothetical protein